MEKEIKSLDIGTMYLVSASKCDDDNIQLKKLRHAFLEININSSMTQFLKEEGMQYAGIDRALYALGDSAFRLAYTTGKNIKRPMQDGILNPKEEKAEIILNILVEALIGKASLEDSICYYSVPAEPFEGEHRVAYHSGIIEEIITSLGYNPKATNEGLAVVYSGLGEKQFTGIGISCGCGLLNVCLSYKGIDVDSFSINRAGDWIDENAAKAIGIKTSKVTSIKEKGVNLKAPKGRSEKAIAIYYKDLIVYTIERIKERLEKCNKLFLFNKSIDIVCAGGTSLPEGFISIFENELSKVTLPLKINQVHLVDDPLYAVARGCYINAASDEKLNNIIARRATKIKKTRPKAENIAPIQLDDDRKSDETEKEIDEITKNIALDEPDNNKSNDTTTDIDQITSLKDI